MYEIELTYGRTYELILSLGFFFGDIKSDTTNKWRRDLQFSMSSSLSLQLESLRERLSVDELILIVWQSPFSDDVDAFISWFRKLTPGDIYQRVVPYVSPLNPSLKDAVQWRDNNAQLLETWNEAYFQSIHPVDLKRLRIDVEEKQTWQASYDTPAFVERVLHGLRVEPTEGLSTVLLLPKLHGFPANARIDYESLILFAYSMDEVTNEEAILRRMAKACKALGEVNRLRIIQYLNQGPSRFIDIVENTGISKSTVHNDLITLREAGFVRVHIRYSEPDVYSLKPDALKAIGAQVTNFIGE